MDDPCDDVAVCAPTDTEVSALAPFAKKHVIYVLGRDVCGTYDLPAALDCKDGRGCELDDPL